MSICSVPTKSATKTKLRQDGVYVQFGNRVWNTENGVYTTNHWYNMIRVVDNETLFVLGNAYMPFWDSDSPRHMTYFRRIRSKEYKKCDHKNPIDSWSKDFYNEEVKGCRCFSDSAEICEFENEQCQCGARSHCAHARPIWNKNFYEYLGISDPSDPIKTSQEILNMPKDKIVDLKTTSFCSWRLMTPIDENPDLLGWAQSNICNDDFSLYYKYIPLIIVDSGSPCTSEYINGQNVDHDFPRYFIPKDLNDSEIWKLPYQQWKDSTLRSGNGKQ